MLSMHRRLLGLAPADVRALGLLCLLFGAGGVRRVGQLEEVEVVLDSRDRDLEELGSSRGLRGLRDVLATEHAALAVAHGQSAAAICIRLGPRGRLQQVEAAASSRAARRAPPALL